MYLSVVTNITSVDVSQSQQYSDTTISAIRQPQSLAPQEFFPFVFSQMWSICKSTSDITQFHGHVDQSNLNYKQLTPIYVLMLQCLAI